HRPPHSSGRHVSAYTTRRKCGTTYTGGLMDLKDLLAAQAGDDGQPHKESPLKSLQVDLDFYSASIKEIAVEIMAEGLSAYPVFIAHQHEVALGELILDKDELGTN